ncbi:MAG TPA: hypothetical protein VMD79_06570 [Solirubrobacteraceae bacterium]|nr:hypothetical protein [Solirubrobacteraceae bacterium]
MSFTRRGHNQGASSHIVAAASADEPRRRSEVSDAPMHRPLKRKLLFALATCAVLAGVSAAVVMAAQPSAHAAHHARGAHAARAHARAAQRARHSLLATAASYLGVSRARLRSELRAGKSLADVAAATPGKSAQGLIAALENAQKAKLAARTARLPARIRADVERTGLPHRRRRRARAAHHAAHRAAARAAHRATAQRAPAQRAPAQRAP